MFHNHKCKSGNLKTKIQIADYNSSEKVPNGEKKNDVVPCQGAGSKFYGGKKCETIIWQRSKITWYISSLRGKGGRRNNKARKHSALLLHQAQ